jgi:TRAP-type mannitol/chloroaromatic compound transport system permease small subunit
MQTLRGFANAIGRANERLGRALMLLVWFTALVCATVVILRYAFHLSFAWMQELYVWAHAIVFMLGVAYAMLHNAHVRVDIFYTRWSPRTRAWVELTAALLFTLPWMAVTAWLAWPIVVAAWSFLEGAAQPNGIPAQFLFKTIILLFCLAVALQALALMARAILVLCGDTAEAKRPPFGEKASP